MFDSLSLSDLFKINYERQLEIYYLFRHIKTFPTDDEIKLLHDSVSHSIPEGIALLEAVQKHFEENGRFPDRTFSAWLSLPKQINLDDQLKTYLETEHRALLLEPQ